MGRLGFISTLSRATGTITGSAGGNIVNTESVVIGGQTFQWVTPLANKYSLRWVSDDIEASLQSLVYAIMGTGTVGVDYLQLLLDDRAADPYHVTATRASGVVTLTAQVPGKIGNHIPLVENTTGLSVSAATLTGGAGNVNVAIDELQAHSQMTSELISALAYMETGE